MQCASRFETWFWQSQQALIILASCGRMMSPVALLSRDNVKKTLLSFHPARTTGSHPSARLNYIHSLQEHNGRTNSPAPTRPTSNLKSQKQLDECQLALKPLISQLAICCVSFPNIILFCDVCSCDLFPVVCRFRGQLLTLHF